MRALFIAVAFFTVMPVLISLQWLLGKLGLTGWGFIACNYYNALRALLRIRVRVDGAPVRGRAVLYISNHVSWVDILVIGSLSPVAFVAKSEVRQWPLIGITADIQRTVFGSPPALRWCFFRKAPRATATACCRSARR
jgi:1-acyl-sn-glycerol-3-phosphate acyltransferase